jgi:hypothetical protein
MADLAQIRSGFVGLTTARSADATPPGGLLEAENVCIRTENVITPRPGFAVSGSYDDVALGCVEYPLEANRAGIVIQNTGVSAWDGFSGETADIKDEDGANLAWSTYEGVVARRNLYLCTSDALRRVVEPGAAVAYRAGAPAPQLVDYSWFATFSTAPTSDGGPSYPSDGYRSYRAVTLRKLGDLDVRSAPSARLVQYESTTPANVAMVVLLGDDFRAGDIVELYASEFSATTPVDEHYFAKQVEVTAAHITAGFIGILDDVPDDNLGAALYTNASREGAEAGNERPPQASCMALFNDSLWLGDLKYPAEMLVSLPIKMFGAGATLNDPKYVNSYAYTGTFTAGSASVTGLSSTTELLVGMLLVRPHGVYRITAVDTGASTMTLHANWGGASGAAAFTAHDSIRIGSEYYPAGDITSNIRGVPGSYWVASTPPPAYTGSSLYAAEYVSDHNSPDALIAQSGVFSGYITNITMRLRCLLASTAAPQVWATHGDLYTPVLPEPTEATGYQMPQDDLPDHVAWSKQSEPDHFPLTNIERVGDGGATVYALGKSRSALVIATDQGLWRGYGYADSSISFSELDADVRILGRRCMAPVGPNQYVAADRGVFEVDENTATNITDDRINDLEALFALVAPARGSSLKLVSNAKDDELIVCVPDDETANEEIRSLFVFNTSTRAWTEWTLPGAVSDMTVKGPEQRLFAPSYSVAVPWLETLTETGGGVLRVDGLVTEDTTVTVATVDGTSVTINALAAWTPEVGDMIDTYLITDVASATEFTVHTTGLTTGAKAFYVGINCVITPSVNTLKTPRFMKVWAEGAIHWARRSGVYAYALAFRSAITGLNTSATQTRTLAPLPGSNTDARSAPAASRFTVSRAAARGTHLCFTVTVRQARADWAIEAISVRARTTADKAPARLP